MAAHPVLEPLIAAGLTATVRPDGRLSVTPAALITPELDAYIRAHRDELIAVLTTLSEPIAGTHLERRPREPDWFKKWMVEDDARRLATLAAALQRKTDRREAP